MDVIYVASSFSLSPSWYVPAEALGGRMEEYVLLFIAVAVLAYLFYVLLNPEKF